VVTQCIAIDDYKSLGITLKIKKETKMASPFKYIFKLITLGFRTPKSHNQLEIYNLYTFT